MAKVYVIKYGEKIIKVYTAGRMAFFTPTETNGMLIDSIDVWED
jgi:hypothetical protein